MRSFALTAAVLTPHIALASASLLQYNHLSPRAYVPNNNVSASYDYVIIGGGLGGLVMASRLSEQAGVTVLVLEAGDTGDAVKDRINAPAGAYYQSIVGTSYDWGYNTVSQVNVNNRSVYWPRGKILGGSTAMNAVYNVRPSQTELDAWRDIMATQDNSSAATWGWNNMLAAMQKSETFVPAGSSASQITGRESDTSTYGKQGPMRVSYPGFMLPVVGNWTPTLEAAGIPAASNAHGGVNLGGYITGSYINPSNWTRSFSKSAYIDSLPPRANLAVTANATVTRILFGSKNSAGDVVATGVEFVDSSAGRNGPRLNVTAKREVIVSAGVMASPQVLMLSGVGPKDVLDAAGVPVTVDLPGVGQRLQDHLAASVVFNSDVPTAGDLLNAKDSFSTSPEFLSFVNSGVAYVNSTRLLGADAAAALQSQTLANLSTFSSTLVPSTSSEVRSGYELVYNTVVKQFFPTVGQMEFLLGTNSPGKIGIQAAMQHPLSVGRLFINSTSVFDKPIIDPQYFSHPADLILLREGLKLARFIGSQAPLSGFLGNETDPGPGVNTDAEWEQWILNAVGTQYHPSGTCAMLPKAQGGVVNGNLQVYGLANVRVIDGSVFPFEFAAHLAGTTFGLAEQAAVFVAPKLQSASLKSVASGWTILIASIIVIAGVNPF